MKHKNTGNHSSAVVCNRKWKGAKKLMLISYEGVEEVGMSWSIVMCINYHQPRDLTPIISGSFLWQIYYYYNMESPVISFSIKSLLFARFYYKNNIFYISFPILWQQTMHRFIFS